MDKKGKRVLFVASQGGHFVQASMIMKELQKKGVSVSAVKAINGDISSRMVKKERASIFRELDVDLDTLELVNDVARESSFFDIAKSIWHAYKVLRRIKPRCVISTGAMPGLLFIIVARCLGIKTIWIDSVANVDELSSSGKVAIRFSTVHLTQWEHLEGGRTHFEGRVL